MPQTLMTESAAAAAATSLSSSSSLLLKSSSSSSSIHSHQHHHHKAQEIYLNNNNNTTTHKHKIETHHSTQDVPKSKSTSGDGESDEDVLHVVTNVYTIPIIKSSSSTINNANEQQTLSTSSIMHNSMSIPIVLGEPRVEATRVRSTSSSSEKRTVIRRVVDNEKTQQLNQDLLLDQQQQSNTNNNNTVKSKFQIRSIVEIYENQDENNSQSQQVKDVGYFNSNTQFNETITKEVIPDVKGTQIYKSPFRSLCYYIPSFSSLNPFF
jgi:hypothetical protein